MKKYLFLLGGMLLLNYTSAQKPQIPNGDFEQWENAGTLEIEPLHWSSLKTADYLAGSAPNVIDRDNGRNGGYGVKLWVPSQIFGVQPNGILTNGRVHAELTVQDAHVY